MATKIGLSLSSRPALGLILETGTPAAVALAICTAPPEHPRTLRRQPDPHAVAHREIQTARQVPGKLRNQRLLGKGRMHECGTYVGAQELDVADIGVDGSAHLAAAILDDAEKPTPRMA